MNTIDPDLYEALRASPLGKNLSREQATILAGLVTLQTFPRHEVIASEDSVDSRLIVVVGGSLGVVRHRGAPTETLLASLHPGDIAHELGFLDGSPRYASLVAASEARVLVLEREKLESLIETDPRLLYLVMCVIVRAVHTVQTRLSMQAGELTNYIVKQHGRY
jgi:CRP/FNR family cyclic AMP-dependent transcriptional regulator